MPFKISHYSLGIWDLIFYQRLHIEPHVHVRTQCQKATPVKSLTRERFPVKNKMKFETVLSINNCSHHSNLLVSTSGGLQATAADVYPTDKLIETYRRWIHNALTRIRFGRWNGTWICINASGGSLPEAGFLAQVSPELPFIFLELVMVESRSVLAPVQHISQCTLGYNAMLALGKHLHNSMCDTLELCTDILKMELFIYRSRCLAPQQ